MKNPTRLAIALLVTVLCGPILALSAIDGGPEADRPPPAGRDAAVAPGDASVASAPVDAGIPGLRRKGRRRDGGMGLFPRFDARVVPIAPATPPPPPPPPPPTPPTPPPPPSTPGATAELFAGKNFNSCQKLPSGKRVAKLNLKPDSDLVDLIAWISAITCKQFVLSGSIAAGGKKVTILAPGLMTPEEAYRAFLNAIESIGLTVVRTGRFLTVIEVAKAKTASVPVYDFNGRILDK